MRTRPAAAILFMPALLLLLVACGPSQEEIEAKKAAEEKARVEAAIEKAKEASKPPVLTEKDVIVDGKDGLRYVDFEAGTGKEAVKGGTVTVEFTGWVDGVKIDSSEDRGKPFSFIIGAGSVIDGWNVGIEGMREGGDRLLIIPPNLAYGEEGRPGFVGRNKTLWYRIKLLKAYEPY